MVKRNLEKGWSSKSMESMLRKKERKEGNIVHFGMILKSDRKHTAVRLCLHLYGCRTDLTEETERSDGQAFRNSDNDCALCFDAIAQQQPGETACWVCVSQSMRSQASCLSGGTGGKQPQITIFYREEEVVVDPLCTQSSSLENHGMSACFSSECSLKKAWLFSRVLALWCSCQ